MKPEHHSVTKKRVEYKAANVGLLVDHNINVVNKSGGTMHYAANWKDAESYLNGVRDSHNRTLCAVLGLVQDQIKLNDGDRDAVATLRTLDAFIRSLEF